MPSILYSIVAWVFLAISVGFGLGFQIIALWPRVTGRVVHIYYTTRIWLLGLALVGGIAILITSGFSQWVWTFVALQFLFTLVNLASSPAIHFHAIAQPDFESDASKTSLSPVAPVIVVEANDDISDVRAYPLTFVAHHHVINDRTESGKKLVVSFCPICNSASVYDATDFGGKRGFKVAAFFRGNIVMTDSETHTIWQQITGESIAGKLHPSKMPILYSQTLTWKQASALYPNIKLVRTTTGDRRPFGSAVPLVWKKFLSSNFAPGVRRHDDRFPAHTRVIGIEKTDGDLVYLKDEVARIGWVRNDEARLLIVLVDQTASAFLTEVDGIPRKLASQ